MATLAEIRQKYPQYQDMSDRDLASALHSKFYSDIPRQEFDAKIGLPPTLDQQADAEVANVAKQAGFAPAPVMAEGILGIGGLVDEAAAAATTVPYWLSGGAIGRPYDKNLATQRAYSRASEKARPIWSQGGKAATGLVTGGQLLSRLPATQSLGGATAQSVAVGTPLAAVEGFTRGEGGVENRAKQAGEMAVTGGLISAVAPAAITGAVNAGQAVNRAVSPLAARVAQNYRNTFGPRQPTSGGAAAQTNAPPPISGAEAAADQILANQMARAGLTADDLSNELARLNYAGRLSSSGRATDVAALADLNPGMRKLAGSVTRQSPEAYTMADDFLTARQTGITPSGMMQRFSGIETRPRLSPRREADRYANPVGQRERIIDSLERAYNIKDYRHHGLQRTGYQTEKAILEQARAEAQPAYQAAFKASEGKDLRAPLEQVVTAWRDRVAGAGPSMRKKIEKAISEFTTSDKGLVRDLNSFDDAKQVVDDIVDTLFRKGNRKLGGLINQFKNDMIAAVDTPQYAAARSQYSDAMTMRDAIELGRKLAREDSDVAVDMIRALSEGERKLVKVGHVDALRTRTGRLNRNRDVSSMLQTPNAEEIMTELIENTPGKGVFSDRSMRLGELINAENQMQATRRAIQGGSPTAERLAADEAFQQMSGMVETIKQNPTLTGMALKSLQYAFDRLFGFRADTARFLARKLFTADPAERAATIAAISRRLQPNQMQYMMNLLEVHRVQAASMGAAQASANAPRGVNE